MRAASPWRRLGAFALDYAMILAYLSLLAALMLTPGRPPYDLLAGAVVRPAALSPASKEVRP